MSRSTRLWLVLSLNLALVGVLVAVGIGAHSLGVMAEGADYLADAAGIGVALMAIWLSRRPPTVTRPNGFLWATAWAALVNAGWLLILTMLVSGAAIARLLSGTREVRGFPVLIVSAVAALAMVAGALILGSDDDEEDEGGDLNMRAVLLDTAADAAAAGSVAVTGAIILATSGNYWLDPSVALVVSAVVAYHSVKLLRRVIGRLRAGSGGVA
jgi:cobalt-zinc-cadmium efflux system protein